MNNCYPKFTNTIQLGILLINNLITSHNIILYITHVEDEQGSIFLDTIFHRK